MKLSGHRGGFNAGVEQNQLLVSMKYVQMVAAAVIIEPLSSVRSNGQQMVICSDPLFRHITVAIVLLYPSL